MKTKSFYFLIITLLLMFGAYPLYAQQSLLYEDFNSVPTSGNMRIPQGWDVSEGTTNASNQWRSATGGYEGIGMSFNSNKASVGTTSVLKTPLLELNSDKILSFYFKNQYGGEFNVYVDVLADDNHSFERYMLDSGLVAADWTLRTYQLNQYTGKKVKIAFKSVSNKADKGATSSNHYLDNVSVEDVSICAYPMLLDLYSVQQNSASIVWFIDANAGSIPTHFRIMVTDLNGTIVGEYNDLRFESDGSNIYTIEGLNSNSTYKVKLRSDCSEDSKGISKWSDEFTFRTLCEAKVLPFVEKFDDQSKVLSPCWIVNPNNISGVEISDSNFKYGDSGYSLILKGSSTKSSYVVSQQIAHKANDLEISFMIYGDYGLRYNVGLTTDPLSADAFEIIWDDTINFHSGWHEVRFCTDASYYATQENISVFIGLPAGISGSSKLYIDDFSVKVRPTCPRLEKVRIDNILAQSADLAWTEFGKVGNYEVEIVGGGATQIQKFTTNPCKIEGLEGNSEYSVRVRSVCSATESGEWSEAVTFVTACGVMESNVFQQSFEASSGVIPECWLVKQFVAGYGEGENYGNQGIDIYTPVYSMYPDGITVTEAKDGNKVLRFRKTKGGTRTALVVRPMQIDVAGAYDVSFWMYRHAREVVVNGEKQSEQLRVLVNNTPDTIGAIELGVINAYYLHLPQVDGVGYYQYDYNIPLSGTVYLMIEALAASYGNDMYVDDIRVYPAPTCRKIKDIEMLPPTQTAFGMKWVKGANETSWIVKYRLTDPNTGATIEHAEKQVNGSTPEFWLEGLAHSTEYRIAGKVAAYCGEGDTSIWVDFDYKFMTECSPIAVYPYEQYFEGQTFPPVCWSMTVPVGSIERHERSDYIYEGAGVMMEAPGNGQALVTPQFRFESGKKYRISFVMMRNSGDGGVKVMLNDRPDTLGAEQLLYIPTDYLQEPKVTKKGYYQYRVDFDAVGDKYLMFVQTSTSYASANDYIDNVIVAEKPACEVITSFEVRNVSSYSAQLFVSEDGVDAYEVSLCKEGVSVADGLKFTSDTTIVDLINLEVSTTYNVYVRSVCSNGVYGEWTTMNYVFTTLCEPFAITKNTPFTEGFEEFVDATQLEGCYLSEGGYFRVTKEDLSTNKYQSMNHANTGMLYAWINGASASIFRPVLLKAGVYYEISAYAIQAGTSGYISFGYSKSAEKDSMTTVLFQEYISESWNKHLAYFTVEEDGVYFFGIDVYASTSAGIDDIIIQEISCAPATTGIANLTSSSASVKITDMSAGKWLLSVNDFEFVPENSRGNVFYDTITSQYTDLSHLMADKEYFYAVKSLCGVDDESSWSSLRTFRTRCSSTAVPFTESFEYGFDCWTFVGENQYVNSNSAQKVSGNLGLGVSKATVITPELDVESLADYMITGWVRSNLADVDLSIGVMLDPADVSTFEPIGSFHVQEGWKWYQFKMYFNDLLMDDYVDFRSARYVAIYLPQEDVSFFMDDIEIKLAPTCKQPVESKFDGVTSNSVTMSWTSKGNENSWNVVGYIGERVMVDTVVATNPATITNLKHSTTYEFEVKAICSETDSSDFTNVGRITTECGLWELPYVEDFKSYSYGSLPLCWEDGEGASVDSKNNWRVEYSRLYFESVDYYNATGNQAAILSPLFDLTKEEGARLNISLMNKYADTVTIKLSIDGGQTYPILLGEGYTNLMEYTQLEFDLTPYVGNVIRVSIMGKSSGVEGSFIAFNYFEIEKIESCMRPVSLIIQSIGGTSATIQINDTTNATAWQYVCLRQGEYVEDVTTFVDITTNPFTINNLAGFTKYTLYVRTNCGVKQSSWRTIEFMTECAEVNSVPYIESFEDIEDINEGCYTIFTTKTGTTPWRPSTGLSWSTYSDGLQSMQLFSSDIYPLFVIMPQLDAPTTSLQVEFDYLSNKGSYYAPDIVVGVMTDPSDASSFVEVETFVPFEPEKDADGKYLFLTAKVPFNVLDVEYANARIAFKVGPTLYDDGDACIDNIKITKASGCPNIRSIDLVEVGATSVRVAIDYKSAAVQLAYGYATQDIDSMSRFVSTLDTVELFDLTKATNYVVYARSVCGVDTGDWVQPLLFGTNCDDYVITSEQSYAESFNSYGSHPYAFPSCYTRLNKVYELGVEYPKLTKVNASEGDKYVLNLYKNASVALPAFSVPGEKLSISYISYNPQGGTYYQIGLQDDLSDESTFQIVKDDIYATSNTRHEVFDFSKYNVAGKYIVFRGKVTTKQVYIDNIVVTTAPECFPPSDLAIEVFGDTFAVATWNHAPAAVGYVYTLSSSSGIIRQQIAPTLEKLTLTDLDPNTQYVLRMRTVCSDSTEWIETKFRTLNSVPAMPYVCGFENEEENQGWIFANGSENVKFIIGGNSNNSVLTGDKALYVADASGEYGYYDYGSSNIYAYRTFLLDPGDYQVSFDWKCNGEAERDFGRVFFAPTNIYITPGEKIGANGLDTEKYIRLHEADKLSGSTSWKKETTMFTITKPVNYHLLVQWSNDVSTAVLPPLSIDNIQIKPVECGVIESLTLAEVTTSSAVVVFDNPNDDGEVEYYVSSLADGGDMLSSGEVSSDTIRLTALTANTQYYLFARPKCAGDEVSPWTILGFATECLPIEVILGNPFIENFDTYNSTDILDNCWTEEHIKGSNSWLTNVVDISFSAIASAHSGANYMSLSGRGGANKNAAIRQFSLKAQTYYKVSIYARQSDLTAAYMHIVTRNGSELETLVRSEVLNIDYQKISAEFFAPTDGIYELGFMGEISGSSWNMIVDDFSVEALSVGIPVGLVVDAVTQNSVDLSWMGNSAEYQVQILKSDVVVADVKVGAAQATIATLQPSMTYTARVRAVYGTEVSDWASIVFSTECGVIYPPFVENFETSVLTTIPMCWDNTIHSQLLEPMYNWNVIQPAEYSYIGTEYGRCAQIQCASTTGYSMLMTPQIKLDGDYVFSFNYLSSSPTEKLKVVVISDDKADTLGVYSNTDNIWEYVRFDLSAYRNKIVRIGFYATSAKASAAYIVVDNIRVICYVDDVVFEDAICQPSQGTVMYTKNGFSVNSSSLKVGENVIERLFEAQSINECDTLKTLRLTLNPSGVYQYNDTICEGEAYNKGAFAGKNLVLSGYYDALLQSSCGCDSVVRVNLTVLNNHNVLSASICEGDVYKLGNKILSESGIYVDTLVNSRGCDSIVTLTLSIVPRYFQQNRLVCEGEKVQWLDTILTMTGRYERVYKNNSGCDSIVVMNLNVLPSVVEVFDTICLGQEYLFLDTILTESGLYVRTFQNVLRCDSTVHLNLYVSTPEPTIENDYVCEGELYSGYGYSRITITKDTMLIQRFSYPDRCDSLVHIYVDFVERIEIDTTVVISEGDIYEFGENTLSKPGNYREVFTSSVGCDSIVNLTLEVGTGLDGVYALSLVIVPNPISGSEVTYINRDWTTEEMRGLMLEVIDATGKVILRNEPMIYPIAVEGLPTRGVYLVRVIDGTGGVHIGRVVVIQ